MGASGAPLLPPFYFKKASDEGLFRFVADLIERVGAKMPRLMLYHIPPIAVVGWSVPLSQRLREAFPEVIMGIKDLSGDFDVTKNFIEGLPGLSIFPGAEVNFLRLLKLAWLAASLATANVNAAAIRKLFDNSQKPEAEEIQEQLREVRKAVEKHTMMPALKATPPSATTMPTGGHPRTADADLRSRAQGAARRAGGPQAPRAGRRVTASSD